MKKDITDTELIFKENLVMLRKAQPGCLTKKDIADKLKMSATYYRDLENPTVHKTPSFEVLESIALYYNVEVYQLFKKNDK